MSIKQKIGLCIDCPDDKGDQPIIAKRCKNHYWQHRAKVKGAKPISSMSLKKKLDVQTYTSARILFLSKVENKKCAAKVVSNCRGVASEVHHKKGRIGKNFLDTKTWLAVCRNCHQWIEEHPEDAKKRGFSENRLD